MDATTFMIGAATLGTPWLVALMRRRNMSDDLVTVIAVVLAVASFLLGYALDGKPFTLPMPQEFWLGLMASYGGQQGAYRVYKRVTPGALDTVTRVGDGR